MAGKNKKKKSGGGKKKDTGLKITATKQGEGSDFASWYQQVITKSEMIDYYDISGCYILRPWSYSIWEQIQSWFDARIKELGVKPCYFPMFVSKRALETEEDHIDDFAPEVAWVTKSGDTDLAEQIAIRPTSETIMYPAYARWIRSHRDLPLRLNQWTNIVRWEFKYPTPFLRTREFLWQEGHSAFATKEEADVEVFEILDLYARVYEELLAVPVIKGRKSEKEKFAGGSYTTTVEAFIPCAGRAIQGATSHSLGQNFSKMFNIRFEDEGGSAEKKLVWQNSWGLTTRTIGVMIMVHGDNKGLVLPPRIAPEQVVMVYITFSKTTEEVSNKLKDKSNELVASVRSAGVRVTLDDRTDKNPGWKYSYWEQKGVPLRMELGPRDLDEQQVMLVRRDTGEKEKCSWDAIATRVPVLLEQIQADMLARARKERDENIEVITEWKDFIPALEKGYMVLAPWCQLKDSEEWVKEQTKAASEAAAAAAGKKQTQAVAEGEPPMEEGQKPALTGAAKTLCIPFNQGPMPEGQLCFTGNGKPATAWCLWGRSY